MYDIKEKREIFALKKVILNFPADNRFESSDKNNSSEMKV